MDWLNYHHLLYFWHVAKEGSVSKAAVAMHVAQPTVSAQVRSLEKSLKQKLFSRQGRHLMLTTEGEAVFRYADEIFSLGSRRSRESQPRRPGSSALACPTPCRS